MLYSTLCTRRLFRREVGVCEALHLEFREHFSAGGEERDRRELPERWPPRAVYAPGGPWAKKHGNGKTRKIIEVNIKIVYFHKY